MKLMLLVKELREIQIDEGQAGKSFKTTLDYEVQKYTMNY